MALSTSGKESNNSVTVHCGNEMHADVNAAINIRNNCITRVRQSGKAAGNQPYGWDATGKQEAEPVDKTLASKPSGLSCRLLTCYLTVNIHSKQTIVLCVGTIVDMVFTDCTI